MAPAALALLILAGLLSSPIAFRYFAGPVWQRTFNLLGYMPLSLVLPAVSSLGQPLEPIIGMGALLLSDFVDYHLELRSCSAFLQRAARAV